jgi:hypothetical protein
MKTLFFVFLVFLKFINCQNLKLCFNCSKNISCFETIDIMSEENYTYLNLLDDINSDAYLNLKDKRKIKECQELNLKMKEKNKLINFIIDEFENYFEDSSIFFDV